MKNVSKTLSNHLKSITELAARLEKNDGKAPQIEVDMLLSALREMYDEVYRLNSENEEQTTENEQPVAVPKPEPSILMVDTESEPVYAEEPTPEKTADIINEQPSIEEIEGQPNDDLFEEEYVEPDPMPIQEPKAEPKPVAESVETAKEEQKQDQPSLFDYFKSNNADKPAPRTIADTLGNGVKEGIKQKINSNKVSDLRTIININDKFSFMNELFHNNMKGYNDFILRLNAISDRNEALSYTQTIAEQYNWDNESMAVKTFYSVFDRKF